MLVPSEKAEQEFLWLFLLCWFAAICYDVAGLFEKIYCTVIGKALLLIVFNLCTNLAIALSMQQVNSNVGTDPTLFPHTITYITILSIPVFLAIGLGLLSILLMFVFPIVILYHAVPDDAFKEILIPGSVSHSDTPYLRTTRVVQLLSFIVFCGLVLSHNNKITSNYEPFLSDTARSFLYHFEMYENTSCVVKKGVRVAFLGEGSVLVGEKNEDEIVFVVNKCESTSDK